LQYPDLPDITKWETMMKIWIKALVLGLTVSAFSSFAQVSDKLKINFDKLGMTISSVAEAPVPGLLQVMTDKGLFYTTEDGGYLIHGRVYNMNAGMQNETELALSNVRVDGVKSFDGDMIEYKAKDEKFQITVFTDITCGYCRKLHAQMDEYNQLGISVRYLAFPRSGLGGQSFKDMESVWCADDQHKAMDAAKNSGDVTQKQCQTKVAQQYEFGQKIGVSGTPAIILEDGKMIPGYQPPQQLLKILQQGS